MKKQNFTLAELIVSAIPLLAMALMLPALYAKSVTETTVTACMNNQKQISIALYAYAPLTAAMPRMWIMNWEKAAAMQPA